LADQLRQVLEVFVRHAAPARLHEKVRKMVELAANPAALDGLLALPLDPTGR